jgi:Glucose-6-phosphate dehydrogenase subunit N-terminal domain/Glucose-6-phosphate dehydrogenase subunit C-terminal domain
VTAVPGAAAEVTTVAEIERELAELRVVEEDSPLLRTSVMTHLAWVPHGWIEAARATLAGLGERHPSRTVLLVPEPDKPDGLEAHVRVERFQLEESQICSEVIELRVRGSRAQAPGSIVTPLLVSDLPVFLRWRGPLPFGAQELEQLADVTDRLIVDSAEWPDVQAGFSGLPPYFEQVAVSDIAWSRTLEWRRAMAARWPGIAGVSKLQVTGPRADALLLAGWLRSRLDRPVELVHQEADALERVAADGQHVASVLDERTPSDLLSEELDRYERDPVYEQAVTQTGAAT